MSIVDKKATKPAKTKKYGDLIRDRLAATKETDEVKSLSKEAQDVIFGTMEIMASQNDSVHYPTVSKDLVISMNLMKGGELILTPPTGYHAMAASRMMKLANEKGDEDTMYPAYLMAACADIDGKPVGIEELQERMTARDFNTATTFFRQINLI